MSTSLSKNINDDYFNGYYKDIWRTIIPEGLTKAEIDFLMQESNLQAGNKVLDLMCGYGRHTLALSRKGIEVTAIDNLADYVNEIKEVAEKENLPVIVLQENVIRFQLQQEYDLVICMGNSICFFNEEDYQKLIAKISSVLKKTGRFIFHTWMIAETAIKQFKENSWSYIGDLKCLYDSKYLFFPSRMETESIFIAPNGNTEIKKAIDYIYSLNETENMLNRAGFAIKEIWSIPGKKKFTLGEPRIYVVAEKI